MNIINNQLYEYKTGLINKVIYRVECSHITTEESKRFDTIWIN